jgi:hypothetical protein
MEALGIRSAHFEVRRSKVRRTDATNALGSVTVDFPRDVEWQRRVVHAALGKHLVRL